MIHWSVSHVYPPSPSPNAPSPVKGRMRVFHFPAVNPRDPWNLDGFDFCFWASNGQICRMVKLAFGFVIYVISPHCCCVAQHKNFVVWQHEMPVNLSVVNVVKFKVSPSDVGTPPFISRWSDRTNAKPNFSLTHELPPVSWVFPEFSRSENRKNHEKTTTLRSSTSTDPSWLEPRCHGKTTVDRYDQRYGEHQKWSKSLINGW